jgi:hypothetical protein
MPSGCCERFCDAIDGVVVAQRKNPHARACSMRHDVGRLERAVGARGVRLQIEDRVWCLHRQQLRAKV